MKRPPVSVRTGTLSSKKICSWQASSMLGAPRPSLSSSTSDPLRHSCRQWKVASWQLCTDCTVNLHQNYWNYFSKCNKCNFQLFAIN